MLAAVDYDVWIALGAVVVSFVLATVLARLARQLIVSRGSRDEVRELARMGGSFVFWVIVAAGLVVALAVIDPDSLHDVPGRIVDYLPRLAAAGLFMILGNVLGSLAATAVGQAIRRATGEARSGPGTMTRAVVLVLFGLLAVSQLGVDTTVLNMMLAGTIGALAVSFALLVGLGGQGVAQEISAGRYLRRVLPVGAQVRVCDGTTGVVVAVHPASTEIYTDDGLTVHLPNSDVMSQPFQVLAPPVDVDVEPEPQRP